MSAGRGFVAELIRVSFIALLSRRIVSLDVRLLLALRRRNRAAATFSIVLVELAILQMNTAVHPYEKHDCVISERESIPISTSMTKKPGVMGFSWSRRADSNC